MYRFLKHFNHIDVACEQAFRGALEAGWDKEGRACNYVSGI